MTTPRLEHKVEATGCLLGAMILVAWMLFVISEAIYAVADALKGRAL